MNYPDGSKYVGEWNMGMRDGHGILSFPDGSTYVGQWKEDKKNGNGTFIMADWGKICR